MRSWYRIWRQLELIGCVLALFAALGMPQVLASVHTYPEGANQVMVRSLQTLRDQADHAWQVVLFNRSNNGQLESLHLRLAGFPGVAELERPHPLVITTGTEQVLTAADLLTESNLPPNIGEYDVLSAMSQLDSNTPLRLTLPTKPHLVELLIPPFVVQEWRQIAGQSP